MSSKRSTTRTVGRLIIVSGSDPKPISSDYSNGDIFGTTGRNCCNSLSIAAHVLVIGAKMVTRRLVSRRALGSACAPVSIAIPMYMLGLI